MNRRLTTRTPRRWSTRTTRHLRRSLAVLGLIACVTWGSACAKAVLPDPDKNTNWLSICQSDQQCGGDFSCLCGVCTKSCTSTDACQAVNKSSTCVSTKHAAAGPMCTSNPTNVPGVCIASCQLDSECHVFAKGLSCRNHTCIALPVAIRDAGVRAADAMSVDAASDDAGTGAQSDAAGATVQGDAAVSRCGDGIVQGSEGCDGKAAHATCVSCQLLCDTGFMDCDGVPSNGCEINLQADPMSCGACGQVCTAGAPCGRGVCATLLANTPQSPPVALAADDAYVYWLTRGTVDAIGASHHDGALLRAPVGGGSTTILASGLDTFSYAPALAIDSKAAYYKVNYGDVHSVTFSNLQDSLLVTVPTGASSLAADDTYLYWFQSPNTSEGGTLYRMLDDASSAPTSLSIVSWGPLLLDSTHLYWTQNSGTTFYSSDKDGKNAKMASGSFPVRSLGAYGVSDGTLYVMTGDSGAQLYNVVNGSAALLWSADSVEAPWPGGLAADTSGIYWVYTTGAGTQASTSFLVRNDPSQPANPLPIASFRGPNSSNRGAMVTTTANLIAVADPSTGTVFTLPKP